MIPCNQEGCKELASVRYVWPTDGQTKHSCAAHALKAKSILAVLGYGCVFEPIDDAAPWAPGEP